MASQYFFDTRLLRDHVFQINEEKRIAQQIRESITYAKNSGDPSLWPQYDQALGVADNLVHYFSRMADVLDNTALDAISFQQEIDRVIQEGTEQVHLNNSKIQL